MSRRRVVVTGLGVVTALGCELDDVWASVCTGKSGVGLVQRFDCRDFKVRFGGEIGLMSREQTTTYYAPSREMGVFAPAYLGWAM